MSRTPPAESDLSLSPPDLPRKASETRARPPACLRRETSARPVRGAPECISFRGAQEGRRDRVYTRFPARRLTRLCPGRHDRSRRDQPSASRSTLRAGCSRTRHRPGSTPAVEPRCARLSCLSFSVIRSRSKQIPSRKRHLNRGGDAPAGKWLAPIAPALAACGDRRLDPENRKDPEKQESRRARSAEPEPCAV